MKTEGTNYYQTEGIIIKRDPYRENSLFCRSLTRDYGIISLVARGVFNEKSSFTGLLEPFSQIQMELYRTQKTQIYTMRTAHPIKIHLQKVRYRDALLAHAAAELLFQIEYIIGESADYYDLLIEYLNYLSRSEYHPFLIFIRFITRLLILLGISLEMTCTRCRKHQFSYFFPQEDGFLCNLCHRPVLSDNLLKLKPETVAILDNIYRLKEIQNQDITGEIVEEIKNIILIHLANHYNKQFHLKSLNDYR